MYYSFSSFFFFSRSRTVQTQLSSSRDAAVRPRVFRGARERWRDHTRCRWEETALTLERGSVRTEARARSFAYLLPTAPRIPFDLFPFNLPADRPTIHDPPRGGSVSKPLPKKEERKRRGIDARFRYIGHNIEERGGPRGSPFVIFPRIGWTGSHRLLPSHEKKRKRDAFRESNLRPMERRISCSITEEELRRR